MQNDFLPLSGTTGKTRTLADRRGNRKPCAIQRPAQRTGERPFDGRAPDLLEHLRR